VIELDGEQPLGCLVLELLDRVFDELERLRIELAMNISPKSVYQTCLPCRPARRALGRRPHHVVLRDDGAVSRPWDAPRASQLYANVRRRSVDRREISGSLAELLGRSRGAAAFQHALRLDRLAHGRRSPRMRLITMRPFVRIVRRARLYALQRVAADAVEQLRLLVPRCRGSSSSTRALLSWPARFFVFFSLMSAVAACPFATVALCTGMSMSRSRRADR